MNKISDEQINKKILKLIINSQDRYRLNDEQFEKFATRYEESLNILKKKIARLIIIKVIGVNLASILYTTIAIFLGLRYWPDVLPGLILSCCMVCLFLIIFSIKSISIYRRIIKNNFYEDELLAIVEIFGWMFIHNLEMDYCEL